MSLKKNVIANYLGNGWTSLMNLVFVPYYIQYLGMEAYGLIGFYATLQACMMLLDLGMTPTLSREMARFKGGAHTAESIRDLLRSLEVIFFSIALTYCLAIWVAADWVAHNWLQASKLPVDTVAEAFLLMGVVTAFRFIEGLFKGAIMGLQKQVVFNIVNAAMATLRGLGAVFILASFSPTISAYFFWQAAISVVTLILFIGIVYSFLPQTNSRTKFSFDEVRKVWKFAAGVMVTTLLAIVLTQIDKILLSKILTLEKFGNYSLVATVTNILVVLVGPITQAHYPKLAELKSLNDTIRLKSVFHFGAQLATAITGSAAILLFFFGKTILTIWTGNEELAFEVEKLLKLMSLGTFLNCLMHMPYALQLAYGWSSFAAKVNMFAVIFLVPAIFYATPVYGALGAAWVWLILNAGYVFISSHFMFKKILSAEKKKWFINDLFLPILGLFLTIFIFWFIMPEVSSKFINLAYILLTGAVAFAISVCFSPELRLYATSWLRQNLKKGAYEKL
jgi:O-antigen/teichoic acid export membrane protein